MSKIKYLLKCIREMDFKSLFATVGRVNKKSGKLRIYLFFDIIICGLKYGAGYLDYELYEFYSLTPAQRATYIVRTTNNAIARHCNDRAYYDVLGDKVKFNTIYNEFLKRDWLDFRTATREDFAKFIDGKKAIISKPLDACCGLGVFKVTLDGTKTADELYDELKANPDSDLLEDYVIQHHKISEIYPHSVNTCRIMTLLKGDDVIVTFAAMRIGNNGKVVDNINNGGFSVPIDIETGTMKFGMADKTGVAVEAHPMTGTRIIGFEVPYWKEALELCKKAAHITPQLRYCGWDVAITEDGPLFIEGNNLPGYDIMQQPAHTPDRIGMLPFYRSLLGDEMEL